MKVSRIGRFYSALLRMSINNYSLKKQRRPMKNSLTIVLGKTVTERKFVLPQNTFTKRKLFFNVL